MGVPAGPVYIKLNTELWIKGNVGPWIVSICLSAPSLKMMQKVGVTSPMSMKGGEFWDIFMDGVQQQPL